jgi:hypothetical protein
MTARRFRHAWLAGVLSLALVSGCTGSEGEQIGTGDPDGGRTGPDSAGDSWVVTLGDSYISGEGARWAGNTGGAPGGVDALGTDAYLDHGRRESEPGCHRAEESIADIGAGWSGHNLACSGATASSRLNGGSFKPGLDFFDDGKGHIGQALALERFARTHNVGAVVVSIGGNDFNFASVVAECATDFVATVGGRPTYCKNDAAIRGNFDDANEAAVASKVSAALMRVVTAMQRAGYGRSDYSVTVLSYPSPIAPGGDLRYPQTLAARGTVGGCPVYNADATWALNEAFTTINAAVAEAVAAVHLTNVRLLDMSDALIGHRLCERGVDQLSETSLGSWQSRGAAAQLEWVNMAYTKGLPWLLQESFHPNYWGMVAERSCVQQVVTAPVLTGGRCVPAADTTRGGQPVMRVLR